MYYHTHNSTKGSGIDSSLAVGIVPLLATLLEAGGVSESSHSAPTCDTVFQVTSGDEDLAANWSSESLICPVLRDV